MYIIFQQHFWSNRCVARYSTISKGERLEPDTDAHTITCEYTLISESNLSKT